MFMAVRVVSGFPLVDFINTFALLIIRMNQGTLQLEPGLMVLLLLQLICTLKVQGSFMSRRFSTTLYMYSCLCTFSFFPKCTTHLDTVASQKKVEDVVSLPSNFTTSYNKSIILCTTRYRPLVSSTASSSL